MNRKKRAASARSQRARHRRTPPIHSRRVEPTLDPSAVADADDDAEFRALFEPALAADHPAAFLVRASTFLAVALEEQPGLPRCAEAIERLDQVDSVLGHALLIAVSVLAPTADDRAHAQRAAERRSPAKREQLPDWLLALGQASAVRAIDISDLWWDTSFQAIELEIAGRASTVFIEVDHVAGFVACRGNVADASIAAFFDEFPESLVEPGTTASHVDLATAGRRFAYAIDQCSAGQRTSMHDDPDWPLNQPLAGWAARLACAAGSSAQPLPADADAAVALFDPRAGSTDLHELKAAFLGSAHGERAIAEGVTGGLTTLLDYAAGHGHRRALRWGPVRVADFLVRYIPEDVWSDLDELQRMPDLLRHWVGYVNERCDMPANMADETLERIDRCRAFYLAIIEARARNLDDFAAGLIADRRS
jgi:hypothetical protein